MSKLLAWFIACVPGIEQLQYLPNPSFPDVKKVFIEFRTKTVKFKFKYKRLNNEKPVELD